MVPIALLIRESINRKRYIKKKKIRTHSSANDHTSQVELLEVQLCHLCGQNELHWQGKSFSQLPDLRVKELYIQFRAGFY